MSIERARKIFSKMPPELFDAWLRPFIVDREMGWPFHTVRDSTKGTEWDRLFLHRGIEHIAQLDWERRELPFLHVRFTPLAQQIINGMARCHLYGIANSLADIPSGRETFLRARKFIAQHGRVAAPCVLMLDISQYGILDGNHRIGALASLPNMFSLNLDAWVGS